MMPVGRAVRIFPCPHFLKSFFLPLNYSHLDLADLGCNFKKIALI